MLNNKGSDSLNLKELKPLIEEAITELEDGKTRLAILSHPSKNTCLRGFRTPDLNEKLKSDYAISSGDERIEKMYFEEIKLLEELIEERDIPISLADWQKGTDIDAAREMYEGMNRRSIAVQLWDWYAIPWRYEDDKIHVIWSPSDIAGTPIIKSYPAEYFLSTLTSILEKRTQKQVNMKKSLNFWKNTGIISLLIIGIIIFVTVI